MILYIPTHILNEGWNNILQSLENWSLYYLNPDSLSFGGYLMLFSLLFLLFSICLMAAGKFKGFFDWISRHLLGTALLLWVLGVIVYVVGFYNDQLTGLAIVPRAIISSFKMFVVSNDLARVHEVLRGDAIYMTLFSMVHFIAAFITFLFIFKMIGYKIKTSLDIMLYKWFRAKGRNAHVFWGVNEASCLLAEDINRSYKQDTIIFIDVDEELDDNSPKKATLSHITNTITIKNSEIARLDAIGALVDHCYNGPAALKGKQDTDIFEILHLKNIRAILQKSSKVHFYFLSNDEAQNIVGALNLQQDKGLCSLANKPVIYVHARKDANNEVFDHYSQYDSESNRMKIKIVDSAYLSIATLKQDENALPVKCINFDETTGLVVSPFTALIVGFGGTGQEAFKFLYEFSAFVGPDKKKSSFKCYAIDEKMGKIAGLVREKMPAIGENELSLVQAAVDSEEFWKTIKTIIEDLNYVVIALDKDAVGLSFAVNLFKYALKHRSITNQKLKIMVRCYDNGNERRMMEVVDNLNRSTENKFVEIRLYGKEKDLYCCNTVLSDMTLIEAKEFNKVYENSALSADEQWQKDFGEDEIVRLMAKKDMLRYHAIYDVNRRISQNISNSLHRTTKIHLMGLDNMERLEQYYNYVNSRKEGTTKYMCSKTEEQLLLNMAMVEHERWVASHKLMGYMYDSKNDCIKKYHRCICDWEDIDEVTQSYDCNVVDTTIKMAYEKMVKG